MLKNKIRYKGMCVRCYSTYPHTGTMFGRFTISLCVVCQMSQVFAKSRHVSCVFNILIRTFTIERVLLVFTMYR